MSYKILNHNLIPWFEIQPQWNMTSVHNNLAFVKNIIFFLELSQLIYQKETLTKKKQHPCILLKQEKKLI